MISIILALVLTNPASVARTDTGEIRKIEERLLAPCCYTQSIAEHGSDIAVQMRSEVTEMVAEGKTEEEIVDHYRNMYGDRILVVPDGLTGKILFSLPVVTAVLACLVLSVCFRRMLRSGKKQRGTDADQRMYGVDDALREKIRREIGEPL
jgi:cytochrome c-type biogenesis protein CcmH